MEHISRKLESINTDCCFVDKIKTSKYLEKINDKANLKKYNNFLFCILDNFDLILSNTSDKDKKTIFHQRISELLSQIDEDSEKFNSYQFNSRYMKQRTIQQNIQISSKQNDKFILSCLYFLNEYYQTHFIIVDLINKNLYETTVKKFPSHFLMYDKHFYLSEECPDDINPSGTIFFDEDVKLKNVYQKYLEPISKYSVGDLKGKASELNICYLNLKKQDLYDKINQSMLNNKFD